MTETRTHVASDHLRSFDEADPMDAPLGGPVGEPELTELERSAAAALARVEESVTLDDALPEWARETPLPLVHDSRTDVSARNVAADVAEDGSYFVARWPLANLQSNPRNVRRTRDMFKQAELTASIAAHGIQDALKIAIVAESPFGEPIGEVRDGDGRREAAIALGLTYVPVRVYTDLSVEAGDVLGLVANLHRADLRPLEKARGFARLRDEHGWTGARIAEELSLSQPTVSNAMRLLALPRDVQDLADDGKLNEAQARAILRFDEYPEIMSVIAAAAVRDGLTSKVLERDVPAAADLQKAKLVRAVRTFDQGSPFAYCAKECPLGAWRPSGAGDYEGYCLAPSHYSAAQDEVQRRKAEEAAQIAIAQASAAERARRAFVEDIPPPAPRWPAPDDSEGPIFNQEPDPAVPALPKIGRDLVAGTYCGVTAQPPAGCTAECACRGRAISQYSTEAVDICLDPMHYRFMAEEERTAYELAREAGIHEAWTRVEDAVATAEERTAFRDGGLLDRLAIIGALDALQEDEDGLPPSLHNWQAPSHADLEWVQTHHPNPLAELRRVGMERLDAYLAQAGPKAEAVGWLLGDPAPAKPEPVEEPA